MNGRREDLVKNKKDNVSEPLPKELEEHLEESTEEFVEEKDEKDLLLAQVKELNDKLLRTQAEMQNVRRVAGEEVTRARLFGIEALVREFLVVGDNIQMAFKACQDKADIKAVSDGLELTLKLFEDSLETAGVIPVDPKLEPFDPDKHEAISVVEDGKKDANTVVEVIQRGFTIQNRILRPAKVIVTKNSKKK